MGGIGRAAIRRLARQGGVKSISGLVHEEIEAVLKQLLKNLIGQAIIYKNYSSRRDNSTITVHDVIFAVKSMRILLPGFYS